MLDKIENKIADLLEFQEYMVRREEFWEVQRVIDLRVKYEKLRKEYPDTLVEDLPGFQTRFETLEEEFDGLIGDRSERLHDLFVDWLEEIQREIQDIRRHEENIQDICDEDGVVCQRVQGQASGPAIEDILGEKPFSYIVIRSIAKESKTKNAGDGKSKRKKNPSYEVSFHQVWIPRDGFSNISTDELFQDSETIHQGRLTRHKFPNFLRALLFAEETWRCHLERWERWEELGLRFLDECKNR